MESAARLDEDILQSVVQLRASTALGDYSELEEQVLEGNLFKELGLKESRGFRRAIEAVTGEVFGC